VLLSHYCYVVTTSMLRALRITKHAGAMVPHSILAVKGCSNGVFGYVRRYGKNTCFLRCTFSSVVNVYHMGLVFRHLNIHDLL
jgi:hypothetical protein